MVDAPGCGKALFKEQETRFLVSDLLPTLFSTMQDDPLQVSVDATEEKDGQLPHNLRIICRFLNCTDTSGDTRKAKAAPPTAGRAGCCARGCCALTTTAASTAIVAQNARSAVLLTNVSRAYSLRACTNSAQPSTGAVKECVLIMPRLYVTLWLEPEPEPEPEPERKLQDMTKQAAPQKQKKEPVRELSIHD